MGFLLAATLFFGLQEVDPKKVDEAIGRGVEYLRTATFTPGVGGGPAPQSSRTLALLTLVHCGLTGKDPWVGQLLREALEAPLEQTYQAALIAMALEELDRVEHQNRIWQCAQVLVDNQCANGQWSYGEPTAFSSDVPTGTPIRKKVATKGGALVFGAPAPREKPPVRRLMTVTRRRESSRAAGDNSNTQYAALGLRACRDAGIVIPRELLEKARSWWLKSQGADLSADPKGRPTPTPGAAGAQGWCYGTKEYCAKGHHPYGAMTAGGLASLAILDKLLGIDWKKDAAAQSAARWLGDHFSVTDHPGLPEFQPEPRVEYGYWLYALERAGMLYGSETFGDHRWYAEGARVLLDTQKPSGAWDDGGAPRSTHEWDTCFAILFLRRATRPLTDVASVDRVAPR